MLLIGILAYLYTQYTMVQISDKLFINDYFDNTTKIHIYNQKTAHLFLNNKTMATHFVAIQNMTYFDNILADHNYQHEVLHKYPYIQKILESGAMFLFMGFILSRGRNAFGFRGSIYSEDKVKTRLKDVAGLEYQKQEIFEFVDFLKNREKYIAVGARMPRGALFHGPPGTGKTLLAKAVAGECDVSFLSVGGPDFSEMFVGVGSARVRDLFKKAREKAPCIVFIDEIDALAKARHNHPAIGHQEKENTLNSFLIELDGFNKNDKVLIFGATNRLDMLDKALLRPGRFDRKIQFELPERKEREKIFKHYLKDMQLDDDIDILAGILSKQSFGFSGADIANICNEASILSVRRDNPCITQEILEDAVDNVLLGPEKKTFRLSERERKIVAYHESGHSLASYLLPNMKAPIKVSIMPRGKSALGFSQTEVSETKLKTKEEILEKICVLLGGRVAELIFCGGITTGAADDIEKSTALAYQYVAQFGMHDDIGPINCIKEGKQYSEKLRAAIDDCVHVITQNCYVRTKELIEKNKPKIEKMTAALLERETLNQRDIEILFE